jgi:CcmD family protein
MIAGLLTAALGTALAPAASAQPAPTEQTQEFVPLDELPPQDQLPAAPLLVAAYVFVLLALFAYVLSVAKRLGGVSNEVRRLEDELKRRGERG